MLKTFALTLAASAFVAVAATPSYKVSLLENAIVDGKQVKAGDYKVELNGNTATLKHGKNVIEVPAHEETASNKFATTEIQFDNKNDLQEIHVGGTNTKIVFGGANQTAGGAE